MDKMNTKLKKEHTIEKEKEQGQKATPTSSWNKWLIKSIHIHTLCQLLIWTQVSIPSQTFAEESSDSTPATTSVEEYNQLQEENRDSQAGPGAITGCSGERTAYESYTTLQGEYTNYANNLSSDISNYVSNANDELTNLLGEQASFYETDQGFVNPTDGIEFDYETVRDRYRAAQRNLVNTRDAVTIAEAELRAAQSACDGDHEHCSPTELRRIQNAQTNLNTATRSYTAAEQEYYAARAEYRRIPNNMENNSQVAVNETAGNANQMEDSHAISGCGSNYDITTNTDEECELSGPLFERDNALTTIVNRNLADAKALAAQRENALFELEIQQRYDADYKLYKLAVDNVSGQEQGYDANGDGDFDDVELGEYTSKSRVGGALEISNIKTMSLASASIRNMACEKHDISENDPQSYYLFRAAMATWLTAVVNDTDYYNEESSCMATEAITEDNQNEQVQALERATNLSKRQLKSLCLRSRPTMDDVIDTSDPDFLNDDNPNGWRRFGINMGTIEASKNATIRYVIDINKVITGYTDTDSGITYPPLETRCDDYLREIIGDDYDPTQSRTREYARDMIAEALGVAIQELATKREKLAIAHANVQKGEQWVARVQRDLMIMAALAAVVLAAQRIAQSMCGPHNPGACAIASALRSKWVYITGTVIGIWLLTELARAQSFLAKWRQKLEEYKYFSHMACNFEDADAEKEEIEALGEEYNQRRREAMRNASNQLINEVNHILYEEISGNTVEDRPEQNNSTTQFENTIKKVNEKIAHIKDINELKKGLSQIFFQSDNKWSDVQTLLSSLGVSILIHALPGDEVMASTVNQEEIYNTTNSLNIQTGTGNFKYFLTQRNQQFQNLTNDITVQPNHSSGTSEISNGGTKSVTGNVILTVDQLAAPFIGGDGHDPLEDITADQYSEPGLSDEEKLALMKTGFATPETRVVTLQNALALMNDNLMQLEYATAIAGYNLDQYVSLLEDTRRELEIEDTGLGNTDAEQVVSLTNACLAESTDELISPDPMCTCRAANSCASFQFPTFNVEVPEALRNSGDSAIKTANNIASGNLDAANVSGASLTKNASRVRKFIDKNAGDKKKNKANSNALDRASENRVNQTLAKINDNPNSTFNKMRDSLAKRGLGGLGNSSLANQSQNKSDENSQKDRNKDKNGEASAAVAGSATQGGLGRKGGANGEARTSESFSLGGGNTNLELSELSDEEKRRLGLLGDGLTNDDVVAIDQSSGRYGHKRKISSRSPSSLEHGKGINGNRKKSIFTIISNRYEKSAYPVLLNVKKAIK
ncbi:MAG: hypothetical protein CME63_17045 [Halobacteriovoraceae bacterium]|nr:hypothetical protein [Halobacteriovoraceae bacterium]